MVKLCSISLKASMVLSSSRLAIGLAVCMASVVISPVKAVESASFLVAQNAKAAKFRAGFQSALQKSCLKNYPRKNRECACYGQIVTKKYRTNELVFMNNWAKENRKSKSNAKKVVPILLMPEMRLCKVTK